MIENLDKVVRVGRGSHGNVFCRIRYDGTRLSITGVEGPMRNGDARGSCGQITIGNDLDLAPGWTESTVDRFRAVWKRWHLNDMRAGCEHQRASWDHDKILEVVTYSLTREAHALRKEALAEAAQAAREHRTAQLTPAGLYLIGPDWFRDLHRAPDADSPQSGLYEVKKREPKAAGWVREDEHPEGLLSKACEVCGYKYGTEWLHEALPADVLAFLALLPSTDVQPAWI